MKRILVLGAGLSSRYLIWKLLQDSSSQGWQVVVAERERPLAEQAIEGQENGRALAFDVNDAEARSAAISNSDIVVNMLPPKFQHLVAIDCIHHGKNMISASYSSTAIRECHEDARRKGVLILTEMGLDPGIDHMIAMSTIHKIQSDGGRVLTFKSYGGALPAPDSLINPFKYFVTWNPRNVVMSGEDGAQYFENGKIKLVPHHDLFEHTWDVEIEGVGKLEAYPNRETLAYKSNFDIAHARTIVRGTLRYPGWCETWLQVVRLGMANENLRIPNLDEMRFCDFLEVFLPGNDNDASLEDRTAKHLRISPSGLSMKNLKWLGLFSEKLIGAVGETPADVLNYLLRTKLKMTANVRDMVILSNEVEAEYPSENGRLERRIISMIDYGERNGFTAIARTVGMPITIAVRLILSGELQLSGSHIASHETVYPPLLEELAASGITFHEAVISVS